VVTTCVTEILRVLCCVLRIVATVLMVFVIMTEVRTRSTVQEIVLACVVTVCVLQERLLPLALQIAQHQTQPAMSQLFSTLLDSFHNRIVALAAERNRFAQEPEWSQEKKIKK